MTNQFFTQPTKLTIFELMFIAITGVSMGILFWTWTFLTSLIQPLLEVVGFSYLTFGIWMISAVLPAFIIRKPLVALISSIIAAFIESLLAKWGLMAIVWGFVQGLGAEIIFALFFYKKWNLWTLYLATLVASFFGYGIDFYIKKFWLLETEFLYRQWGSLIFSAFFLGALPTYLLVQRLMSAGLLSSFQIVTRKEK